MHRQRVLEHLVAERVDVAGRQGGAGRRGGGHGILRDPSGMSGRGQRSRTRRVVAGPRDAHVHAVVRVAFVVVQQGVAVVRAGRPARWSRRCRRCPAGRRTARRRRPGRARRGRSRPGSRSRWSRCGPAPPRRRAARAGAPSSSATNRSVRSAYGGQSAQARSIAASSGAGPQAVDPDPVARLAEEAGGGPAGRTRPRGRTSTRSPYRASSSRKAIEARRRPP